MTGRAQTSWGRFVALLERPKVARQGRRSVDSAATTVVGPENAAATSVGPQSAAAAAAGLGCADDPDLSDFHTVERSELDEDLAAHLYRALVSAWAAEAEGTVGGAGGAAGRSPSSRGAERAAEAAGDAVCEGSAPDWDIAHGPRKSDMASRLTMVLPAVTRVAMNIVGAPLAVGGYAVGKAGEAATGRKSVDSVAFRAGIKSWMWLNGIIPTVQYEPLKGTRAAIRRLYGVASPEAADTSLTPILVSNHICYMDGAVLAVSFGAPKVVAMAGTRKAPIIGKFMEEMEAVFVDRGDDNSREATLAAITGHCSAWTPGSRPLLMFPEGTTSNGEGLLGFKKGAFVAGAPVRPVLIVYTGQWDPASTTYVETNGCVEKLSDADWFAQFLGHFVHSMHVRVLAPYIPDAAERADPALYAENCRAHMARAQARVREELHRGSWKRSAGRAHGGMGYELGDAARTLGRLWGGALTDCVRKPGRDSAGPRPAARRP